MPFFLPLIVSMVQDTTRLCLQLCLQLGDYSRAPLLAQIEASGGMLQPLHSNAAVGASEAVKETGGKSSLAEQVG